MTKAIDEIVKEYFPHDYYPREDEKIIKLFFYFRKRKKEFPPETLQDIVCFAAYGLYWAIVEYMHVNNSPLTEEKLEMLADELRVDPALLQIIMDSFDLFSKQDGIYTNNRIIRNISYRHKKSEQNQKAANARWIVATFNKLYEAEFEENPALTPPEIKCLKDYARTIDNLKEKLPDILYTLKNLKFKDIPNFKPCANWLLAKNNLARLINGEFGKLKHKKTEEELQKEKEALAQEEAELNQPSEFELQMAAITSKEDALNLLIKECAGREYMYKKGKLIGIGPLRELMNKFCITDEEVIEKCVK